MSRERNWYYHQTSTGTVPVAEDNFDWVIADDLVDATLLRTRAFVQLSTGGGRRPAFDPGNPVDPLGLKIVFNDAAFPAVPEWWTFPGGQGEVIADPVAWSAGTFVPENPVFGTLEQYFTEAHLYPAVADSKGQRHLPGETSPQLQVHIGPMQGAGSAGNPEFFLQFWVAVLLEWTP